jgi:hypothetical protein
MICKANDSKLAEFLHEALISDKTIEIKNYNETRNNRQNSALHLWFTHISDCLNSIGETFYYKGISGKEFEIRFTYKIIKEFVIKPLIKAQFGIDSTTKLTTKMINEIIDTMTSFLAEKGEFIPFPNMSDKLDEIELKK